MARKKAAPKNVVSTKDKKGLTSPAINEQDAIPTNSHGSPLFRLPQELRNRIYELTLIKEEPIKVTISRVQRCSVLASRRGKTSTHVENKDNKKDVAKEHALLQTCQQIRNEAIAIYYSNNTFYVKDRSTLYLWCHAIGQKQCAMLTKVQGFFKAEDETRGRGNLTDFILHDDSDEDYEGDGGDYPTTLVKLDPIEWELPTSLVKLQAIERELGILERSIDRYCFHLLFQRGGEFVFYNEQDMRDQMSPRTVERYERWLKRVVASDWELAEDSD